MRDRARTRCSAAAADGSRWLAGSFACDLWQHFVAFYRFYLFFFGWVGTTKYSLDWLCFLCECSGDIYVFIISCFKFVFIFFWFFSFFFLLRLCFCFFFVWWDAALVTRSMRTISSTRGLWGNYWWPPLHGRLFRSWGRRRWSFGVDAARDVAVWQSPSLSAALRMLGHKATKWKSSVRATLLLWISEIQLLFAELSSSGRSFGMPVSRQWFLVW